MGRDLQKRKNRSSRPTIKQSNRLKKPLNPMGNSLVARNWNKKETLSQNYRRLGLTAKLGKATGGVDPATKISAPNGGAQDPLAVTPNSGAGSAFRSVKVERDADGKIVRVLRKDNPLNDPLNEIESEDDDDDDQEGNDGEQEKSAGPKKGGADGEAKVVDLLEAEASRPTEAHKRHQSQQEREWLARLVARHGDDTAAMARDLKLNPMQQTAANIGKKLKIYMANQHN